jgi:hypothetical protein
MAGRKGRQGGSARSAPGPDAIQNGMSSSRSSNFDGAFAVPLLAGWRSPDALCSPSEFLDRQQRSRLVVLEGEHRHDDKHRSELTASPP